MFQFSASSTASMRQAIRRYSTMDKVSKAGENILASSYVQKGVAGLSAAAAKTEPLLIKAGVNTSSISYNFKVAQQIIKQVYHAEKLAPPRSLSEFLTAYATTAGRASNPQWYAKTITSGEWVAVALGVVQVWVFWSVGQAIGRRNCEPAYLEANNILHLKTDIT